MAWLFCNRTFWNWPRQSWRGQLVMSYSVGLPGFLPADGKLVIGL
jgi:hypothetical protein